MGFSLGSVAVMSGFRPLDPSSLYKVFALFELRSMILSVVVLFVLLVLAYLTNPSEASFRAFLTEQAFRHHLSRLDDVDAQDESESSNAATKSDALFRRGLSNSLKNRNITAYSSPPFPFASRASVSLRTPKHIFRSFGILSVAAVVPTSPSNRSSPVRRQNRDEIATRADKESGSSTPNAISDSWFVGAFGMWFWTFNLDALWRDAGLVEDDEVDGTIAGVLGIKALDRSDEHHRTSYASYGNGNGSQGQRSSPKLRSRERFAHQNGNGHHHRSQTPPPLPKSASLPLHTKRGSHVSSPEKSSSGRNHAFTLSSAPSTANQPPISVTLDLRSINTNAPPTIGPSASTSAVPSRSPSVLFASSPLIAELLRQLSSSETAISDLRSQLSDFNSSSASTRTELDDELDRQRERKRVDDAAKAELKAQTKTLDDQKRTAETLRRDAEKRLRAVQSEKINADTRIERYEREINELQSQVEAHGAAVVESSVATSAAVADLEQQIEEKRTEVRTVEDDVAQLSLRLREMEENVAGEEQRLKDALEDAEERKRKYMQLQAITMNAAPPLSPARSSMPSSPVTATSTDIQAHHASRPAYAVPAPLDANLANSFPMLSSPFDPHQQRRASLSQRFAPFSSELASPGPLSPTGESLIPSSLYEPLGMARSNSHIDPHVNASDMSVSRSFQSEDDTILERNWFNRRDSLAGDVGQPVAFPSASTTVDGSPVSPAGSTHVYDALDAFAMDRSLRERASSLRMDSQRASFPTRSSNVELRHNQSVSTSDVPVASTDYADATAGMVTRRSGWFSSYKDKHAKAHEKKGLNPDAKEFSLPKEKERSISAFLSRSRGPGSGHSSNSGSSSTPSSASLSTPEPPSLGNSPSLSSATVTKSSSPLAQITAPARNAGSFGFSLFGPSHAFAPTALEREQLSRALGGTANSSFEKLERLPSLPTSPQLKHVLAQNQSVVSLPPRPWESGMAFGLGTNGSKPSSAFCPFDDDEPTVHSAHSSPSNTSAEAAKQ